MIRIGSSRSTISVLFCAVSSEAPQFVIAAILEGPKPSKQGLSDTDTRDNRLALSIAGVLSFEEGVR